MGSTRLVGKVLADIAGRPMLAHVIERAQRIAAVDEVVVATTTQEEDEAVQAAARQFGAETFAGSVDDVLDRYYMAAKRFRADAVMRVTADCPLLDPEVGDHVVSFYDHGKVDYCSNVLPATYPDGVNIEIIGFHALERTWRIASLPSDREHVTTYIRTNTDEFSVINVEFSEDLSDMRWTVDSPDDLEFMRQVFHHLGSGDGEISGVGDVLKILDAHPEISLLNSSHRRNEGWDRSKAAEADPGSDATSG
jgi:spore coat polysaccharide biosynthesis protein SpsF